MESSHRISASLENYIEAVYFLVSENGVARAKDIAARLGVKASSVTGALRTLSDKGLAEHEPYGFIRLTMRGREVAREVARRHRALTDFFVNVLCVDAAVAEKDACIIEHGISEDLLERVIRFGEFIHDSEFPGQDIPAGFREYCGSEVRPLQGGSGHREGAKMAKLSECHEGDRVTIVSVDGSGAFKKRLLEMGFMRGESIRIVKYAPLRDPLELEIKGFHVSLRVAEADHLQVSLDGGTAGQQGGG